MKKIILFVVSVVTLQHAIGQESKINADVITHIKAIVDEGYTPSIVLSYVERDVITNYKYGNTKLKDGNPVNENTIYEIGSISKVFTCIILADEVLKGRMKLDDPASKYLPKDFKALNGVNRSITLKDLATHTSGLPSMPNNFNPKDPENPFADYEVERLYEFLDSYTLPREVGVQYEYSNLGMGLLGHILELHTKTSYADLIKARITNPLEMFDTDVVVNSKMKNNLAYGHNSELDLTKTWEFDVLAGAGAIKSTTADMVAFFMANVTKSDSDLYKAMAFSHEIAFEDSSQNLRIGLGWHYNSDDTIIWHNGGTGGYRAFGGFLKDSEKAVVVFTNSTNSVDLLGVKQLGKTVELTLPEKQRFPDIVNVSEDILRTYVGKYELIPNFVITIRHNNGKLTLQATGQQEFEICPSAQNEFFLKVVEARVTFNKNDSGIVDSLTLHQNGQNITGKKTE